MATPTFLKLIFHKYKASLADRVGMHVKNAGPHYGGETLKGPQIKIYGGDNLKGPRMKIYGGKSTEMPLDVQSMVVR